LCTLHTNIGLNVQFVLAVIYSCIYKKFLYFNPLFGYVNGLLWSGHVKSSVAISIFSALGN